MKKLLILSIKRNRICDVNHIIVIVSKSSTLPTAAFLFCILWSSCRWDPHSWDSTLRKIPKRAQIWCSTRKPEIKNVCCISLLHSVLPGLYKFFLTFLPFYVILWFPFYCIRVRSWWARSRVAAAILCQGHGCIVLVHTTLTYTNHTTFAVTNSGLQTADSPLYGYIYRFLLRPQHSDGWHCCEERTLIWRDWHQKVRFYHVN